MLLHLLINYYVLKELICHDGYQWRIQDFPEGCANSQIEIILQFLCQKLHENERIWTPRGVRPWRPRLDPPMGTRKN